MSEYELQSVDRLCDDCRDKMKEAGIWKCVRHYPFKCGGTPKFSVRDPETGFIALLCLRCARTFAAKHHLATPVVVNLNN